jgi:hypothetical protein
MAKTFVSFATEYWLRLKVSDKAWIVAQICNLLYRRFAIGRLSYDLISFVLADVQQNKILRYSRLENLRYFLRKMTETFKRSLSIPLFDIGLLA